MENNKKTKLGQGLLKGLKEAVDAKNKEATAEKLFCPKCESESIKKNGFFDVDEIKIQKYVCKECGKHFSAKTGEETAGEHRPELNSRVIELALSGMTAKAIAEELGCAKRTVQMKIKKYITGTNSTIIAKKDLKPPAK